MLIANEKCYIEMGSSQEPCMDYPDYPESGPRMIISPGWRTKIDARSIPRTNKKWGQSYWRSHHRTIPCFAIVSHVCMIIFVSKFVLTDFVWSCVMSHRSNKIPAWRSNSCFSRHATFYIALLSLFDTDLALTKPGRIRIFLHTA